MNSLEDNIFNFVKNKKTFTTNDLFHNFQLDSSSQVRIALKVLVDAGKVYKYGDKRGAFYSIHSNLDHQQETQQVKDTKKSSIEDKIFEFAKTVEFFSMNQILEVVNNNDTKPTVYRLTNEGKLFKFGEKRGTVYSVKETISKFEENQESEGSLSINLEPIKEKILAFAKTKNDWFGRTEITETLKEDEKLIKLGLLDFVDEDVLTTRGAKRWMQYGLGTLTDISDDDDGTYNGYDSELASDVLKFIEKNKVVSMPQLIDEFETSRSILVKTINYLKSEEQIYIYGSKKTTRYVHFEVTEVEDYLDKSMVSRSYKPETKLDSLLRGGFYIHIKNNGENVTMIQRRSLSPEKIETVFDNVKSVEEKLLELMEN